MATDYKALGKRISNARKQAGITQEALGEQLNMTRKHISVIESAIKRPSLDALVDIANALDVSTDDLLVDSLMHSTSTSNSEIHRLLLDCNEIEQEILTRMVREMKAITDTKWTATEILRSMLFQPFPNYLWCVRCKQLGKIRLLIILYDHLKMMFRQILI